MKAITKLLRFAWAVYFLLCFLLFFILFYPLFLIFLSRKEWYPQAHRLRGIWGAILMILTGILPSVKFEEKLNRRGTYILAPNHFSYLDIVTVNVLLPVYFNFMAKADLARIPVFGIFFRTIDIPVERGSSTASHKAFLEADGRLKQGISMLIFPEGKIGDKVPQMSNFKVGAFRLAIENNVPIVPISILDNFKRMESGGLTDGGTPGRMRIIVHKPIQVDGLTLSDIPALQKQVFDIIDAPIKKIRT
jgi:1-acyl-sn-glycerol-3-phosphate acyltransferase